MMEILNRQLQSELDRLRNQNGFPGVTAAYVLRDGSVGEAASGWADLERKEAMTPKSRMLAASIGKTFVAALVLALAKEGSLHLDDLLSFWLSEYPWYSRLPNQETITLKHLLTHSSGLSDHVYTTRFVEELSRRGVQEGGSFPPASLIACIFDQPPLFKPGEGWAYTDTGYILLGLVIEKATGKSYYEELDWRFLKPLKLEMTGPSDRPTLSGLVAGYTDPDNRFGFPRKTIDAPGMMAWNPGFEWTGGGLISTSRDLGIWAKCLYEGHAIQGDYLMDLLKAVPAGEEDSGIQYGLGVLIHSKSPLGSVWGHGGMIPGYSSSMRYYPEYGVAIAFQINTDSRVSDFVSEMELGLAELVIRGGFNDTSV